MNRKVERELGALEVKANAGESIKKILGLNLSRQWDGGIIILMILIFTNVVFGGFKKPNFPYE